MFIWAAYVAFVKANEGLTLFLWLSSLFVVTFICVVLHEYGHALTARKFGVSTRDIILSPIGGMARLENLPERPWHEFLVALAGPLVNLGIFILLGILAFVLGYFDLWEQALKEDPSIAMLMRNGYGDFIIGFLILINIALFVFNLIPAFPMDGGRMLRSLLSMPFGRVKATRIATRIAQFLAIVGAVYCFYNGYLITGAISIFILLSANRENQVVQIEQILEKTKVGQIASDKYTRIYLSEKLKPALEVFTLGLEADFLVFKTENDPELVGVLTQNVLSQVIKENRTMDFVQDKLSNKFELISPDLTLKELYQLMQKKGYSILPVDMGEGKIGKIDFKILNEHLKSQQALT